MIEKNDGDQKVIWQKWQWIEGKENDSERNVARMNLKENVQGAEHAFIEQKDQLEKSYRENESACG